jgi:hypothetical protein
MRIIFTVANRTTRRDHDSERKRRSGATFIRNKRDLTVMTNSRAQCLQPRARGAARNSNVNVPLQP